MTLSCVSIFAAGRFCWSIITEDICVALRAGWYVAFFWSDRKGPCTTVISRLRRAAGESVLVLGRWLSIFNLHKTASKQSPVPLQPEAAPAGFVYSTFADLVVCRSGRSCGEPEGFVVLSLTVGYVSRSRVRCGDVLDLLFTIFVMEIDYYVPKNKETINPYYDVLLLELRGASNLTFPSLNNLVRTLGRHLVDKRPDDGVFREQLLKVGLEG